MVKKSDWLMWQESLNLAYPNEIKCNIEMPKKTYFEGEPLVFRINIINKLDIKRSIIPFGRKNAIGFRHITFKVVSVSDKTLWYCPAVIISGGMSPHSEMPMHPYDTLYVNQIISPDLFRDEDSLKKTDLKPGDYIMECELLLGWKFYPKPARDLRIRTHPTFFHVDSTPSADMEVFSEIRPFLDDYFSHIEEISSTDSILMMLSEISNSESPFAQVANYVYACASRNVASPANDSSKINQAIKLGREFIKRYPESILAEEMEDNIGWWLYEKDSLSRDFIDFCIKLGPIKCIKNLNSWSIIRHMPIIKVQ